MLRLPSLLLLALFVAVPTVTTGQNLVFNPSFEIGTSTPAGWSWYGSLGNSVLWEDFGRTGNRSVSVNTTNGYDCGLQWRTSTNLPFQLNQPYLLRFWGMSTNTGAVAFAGIQDVGSVYRYMGLDDHWRPHDFIAVTPTSLTAPQMRIGQCNSVGHMVFDDAEVRPVIPVHVLVGDQPLGLGESIRNNRYTFWRQIRAYNSRYTPEGFPGNYTRPLHRFAAAFSDYYWTISAGNYITHHYDFPGLTITNATARVATVRQQGDLVIEFSADGTNWLVGTNYSAPVSAPNYYVTVTNAVPVPSSLLPATNLFARVRGSTNATSYLMTAFGLDADLSAALPDGDGETCFFELYHSLPAVRPVGFSADRTGVFVELANPEATNRLYSVRWQVDGPAGSQVQTLTNEVAPASTNIVRLPFAGVGAGENWLTLAIGDAGFETNGFCASARFRETILRDASYGYQLPGQTNCVLWWCEATYKVGRVRALPQTTNLFVSIEAARNEYEPFQIVLRPQVALSNLSVTVSAFTALDPTNSYAIASTNIETALVEYVPVVFPSDYSCTTGDHPDPLVPLAGPFDALAGTNQPLWITVYVPKDTPAGNYAATITIQSAATHLTVPVRLRVFDFALSDVTHTRTAFNVYVNSHWHGMSNDGQKGPVWDLYMQNFARHRVSPYAVNLFVGGLSWSLLNGTNGLYFTHNFANFDTAMTRYLDEFGMNSSSLTYVPSSLNGYQRFTAGYRQLYPGLIVPIMQHVREKGWLDKVYCFWDDEPSAARSPFTIEGMQVVQEASPGLKRLLTVSPNAGFYGNVDIWVPIAGYFDPNTLAARFAAGEEVWWYVSGSPGAPYAMYFTDHAAINPRMRFWGGEKYNLAGELYWNTTWASGSNGAPINPWTNTMMRFSDGSPGGNGNGLLLYPPARTLPSEPLVAGPWNSLRWEIVREGLEDREYFWLLQQVIQRVEGQLGSSHPLVLTAKQARAEALSLVKSKTDYDSDPLKLYAARRAVAEQIELLDDGAVLLVRDPKSQAVLLGETISLRSEAIGWPVPAYQWQHEGTNISGATNAVLTLTNCNSAQLGAWRVVAANSVGAAASAVANLAGYWVPTPQIIAFNAGDNRRVGDRTVLEVTAVSSLPMTYQWYLNGALLAGVTNNAWVITNLAVGSAGLYTVTASNEAGVATSGPITLSVMPAYAAQPPTFSGDWAGPDTGFQLQLPVDNRPRSVLVSTNLLDWSTQFMVAPAGLPQILNDSEATNLPYRFYRVRAE